MSLTAAALLIAAAASEVAGDAAVAGRFPLRTWHRCDRAERDGSPFPRLGMLVTECRTCGIPSDRRCGPTCPGFDPAPPAGV